MYSKSLFLDLINKIKPKHSTFISQVTNNCINCTCIKSQINTPPKPKRKNNFPTKFDYSKVKVWPIKETDSYKLNCLCEL